MGFTRTSVVYATPDLTLGTANAAGSVASAIRSDSTVLVYDTTVPEDVTSGSSTAGDSATAARRNHVHGIGSAAGDVSGGASSIDNGVVRFDGTGGKTIQGGYAMAVAIADTGYLGLGKAAPVSLLDLDQTTTGEGCATFKRSSNVDTTFRDMINFNHTSQVGQILCSNSATQYNTSSDYRLKENVVPITDALERLNELKPSRFNFIISPEITQDGFIAHEVAEVIPEAVGGVQDAVDSDGEIIPQGVDYSKVVPLLTAAILELQGQLNELRS